MNLVNLQDKERVRKKSDNVSKLRELSGLRKNSMLFLDKLEQTQTSSKQALKSVNKYEGYKEILNEIASSRSLMLANTPR